jgi:hypothetical protein
MCARPAICALYCVRPSMLSESPCPPAATASPYSLPRACARPDLVLLRRIGLYLVLRRAKLDVVFLPRVAAPFFFIELRLVGGDSMSSGIRIDPMVDGDGAHAWTGPARLTRPADSSA